VERTTLEEVECRTGEPRDGEVERATRRKWSAGEWADDLERRGLLGGTDDVEEVECRGARRRVRRARPKVKRTTRRKWSAGSSSIALNDEKEVECRLRSGRARRPSPGRNG
jgi:hypothetical protein